jgi:hypothetical protein
MLNILEAFLIRRGKLSIREDFENNFSQKPLAVE